MKKVVILMGLPGCGKGTQAKLLAQKYNYDHISSGQILRGLLQRENLNDLEKQAVTLMKKGALVDDEFVFGLVTQEMEKSLSKNIPVILDGVIRNLVQAEIYWDYFKKRGLEKDVILVKLAISEEEAFDRLTKRRICNQCGEIIPWAPETYDLKNCPKCHGVLEVRADDDPEIIRERIIKQGRAALWPVMEFFDQFGVTAKIDGKRPMTEILQDIEKTIQ